LRDRSIDSPLPQGLEANIFYHLLQGISFAEVGIAEGGCLSSLYRNSLMLK